MVRGATEYRKILPCTNDFQVAITGSALLLVDRSEKKEGEWRSSRNSELEGESIGSKTQGLVQMRLVDLDEDTDMQEASCYVHEGFPTYFLRRLTFDGRKIQRSIAGGGGSSPLVVPIVTATTLNSSNLKSKYNEHLSILSFIEISFNDR